MFIFHIKSNRFYPSGYQGLNRLILRVDCSKWQDLPGVNNWNLGKKDIRKKSGPYLTRLPLVSAGPGPIAHYFPPAQ